MKNKVLALLSVIVLMITASCKKPSTNDNTIDDKDKIDIKGSLSNGDMRNPNIVAKYFGKTVWIWFYDDLGTCTISIGDKGGSVVVCNTIDAYFGASWRFYMGDQPLNRYHLVISNGTDEAEGWFNTFRIVAVKPH